MTAPTIDLPTKLVVEVGYDPRYGYVAYQTEVPPIAALSLAVSRRRGMLSCGGGGRIWDVESARNQFSTVFWHVSRTRWPDL